MSEETEQGPIHISLTVEEADTVIEELAHTDAMKRVQAKTQAQLDAYQKAIK